MRSLPVLWHYLDSIHLSSSANATNLQSKLKRHQKSPLEAIISERETIVSVQ